MESWQQVGTERITQQCFATSENKGLKQCKMGGGDNQTQLQETNNQGTMTFGMQGCAGKLSPVVVSVWM